MEDLVMTLLMIGIIAVSAFLMFSIVQYCYEADENAGKKKITNYSMAMVTNNIGIILINCSLNLGKYFLKTNLIAMMIIGILIIAITTVIFIIAIPVIEHIFAVVLLLSLHCILMSFANNYIISTLVEYLEMTGVLS